MTELLNVIHGLGYFPLGLGGTTERPAYMRGEIDDRETARNRGYLLFSDMC